MVFVQIEYSWSTADNMDTNKSCNLHLQCSFCLDKINFSINIVVNLYNGCYNETRFEMHSTLIAVVSKSKEITCKLKVAFPTLRTIVFQKRLNLEGIVFSHYL